MKITRTKKITASSVDKRLSFTSTKYKGYRISLDHKNNCYNIYDKHGELEDSGYMSQLAAKEAVDKLVKESSVEASEDFVFNPDTNKENINLPGYAVQWISGYGGGGVNNTERKYFRTSEEQEEFVKKLKSQNVIGIKTWKIDNFYHTLPEVEAASYGGAYDIEDDQYFTKEELVEFGNNLAEEISNKYGENWLLESIYLTPEENNHLEIEITNNDIQLKSDLHIDMRRIRQPLDIYKYSKMIIDQLSEGHDEYFEEITSSSKIGASTMYKCMDDSISDEGDTLSRQDLLKMYNDMVDWDPVVMEYNNFDSWLRDTVNNGYLREVDEYEDYNDDDVMYEDVDGIFYPELHHKLSLIELKDIYNELIDMGDPVVEQYNDFDSWLEDTVDSGYLRRIYSSKSIKCSDEEDVEYLDNQDTLREFIDELVENGVDIYDDQDILQELGANYGYDREDQIAILEDIREYVGQSINSAEEIDDDELETTEQEFTSKDTSINSSKLPAIYKLVNFPKGSVVLDFGGGRYDNGVEYLNSIGCEGYVYDPYNRTSEHNAAVVKAIRANGGADIVLNSNVLNVIKEAAARRTVLKNIKKLVKPSGTIYITVYEGNGSGEGKQSKKDSFQLNRKTADYLEEIQEVFPDATRKGKLIVATPNGAPVKSSINASEDTLSSRIFDFLDDCGSYTDYNQKIEDVSEEFGMSPDEAEGYVSSWAQGMDAMWHDTADQYEDQDIEESCKVEASISPSRAKEIVGTLERRLKKKVSQVMQSEEFGFPADEVANYSAVEVEYQPEANRIKCEVRAEVDFGGLMELAEELNPIVEKYNEWAYFDAVTSGIIESYIPLNDVYSSTSTNKKAVTASYSEPEDLVREYEIVFDTTATVTEDSFEIDDAEEFNEIYDDEYNIIVEDDSNSILENLQDLIEVNMPDEPGKYRISGIAHMKYFIDNLYREYEGPSDPDDTLGSSWLNSEAADITYDARSSYVEAFQVEKI